MRLFGSNRLFCRPFLLVCEYFLLVLFLYYLTHIWKSILFTTLISTIKWGGWHANITVSYVVVNYWWVQRVKLSNFFAVIKDSLTVELKYSNKEKNAIIEKSMKN